MTLEQLLAMGSKVGATASRWLWFGGLWAASALVTALVAYALRWVLLG